jgi:hypothetical protein
VSGTVWLEGGVAAVFAKRPGSIIDARGLTLIDSSGPRSLLPALRPTRQESRYLSAAHSVAMLSNEGAT